MSRHWRPQSRNKAWLSPEAYDALSPAEKRQLWFERQRQRHEQRFRSRPARYRKGYYARQRLLWLGGVLLLGAIVSQTGLPLPQSPADNSNTGSAPVTVSFGYCKWGGGTNCVVDGDTFYINGDKIRIAGIDAPETHDYGCESELALGNQATQKLHELLNGGAVTMTSIDRDEDVYGRKLRNVSVNGTDVGEILISEGLAHRYVRGKLPWC